MPEILGAGDIKSLALPAGIDGSIFTEWQMKEGRTYGEFVGSLANALEALNQRLLSRWGWLIYVVDTPGLEYPDGAAVTPTPEITDLDDIENVDGTITGHMLPLKLYGEGVGGTWKYFQRTRESRVQSQLRQKINRLEWRFEVNLLTRLATNTENAIGSGYDVPFVRGAGGNIDYTPPARDGEAFTTAHDHFIGIDTDTKGFDDALEEGAEHLEEHGHEPPYTALVSKTDVAAGSYHALENFVEYVAPVINVIDRGGSTSGNQFFAQGTPMVSNGGIVGYYQTRFGLVEIRSTNRYPTNYGTMVKSYGNNNPMNPLVVRVAEEGFGVYIVTGQSDQHQFPVKSVKSVFEFGIGVNEDRTNGLNFFLDASGNWANPSIN